MRVYLGRDTLSGEKRWVSRDYQGGNREAQRALFTWSRLAGQRGRRSIVRNGGGVAAALIRQQLAAGLLAQDSVEATTGFINRFLKPTLGAFQVTRLRTEDIDILLQELRKTVATTASSWPQRLLSTPT